MDTAIVRFYDGPTCRDLRVDGHIFRAEAIQQILTGFRLARELAWDRDATHDERLCRYMQWAGYEPYEIAAPIGQPHRTNVQLCLDACAWRYEYDFPGGLRPVECDDLCQCVIGAHQDTERNDREREWLVTSTLAGLLHADGVSLADHVVAFACGRNIQANGLTFVPTGPPTTLYAAVRGRGWKATVQWLHDLHAIFEHGFQEIREGRAVWVPMDAPRLPWEPLIVQCRDGHGCRRLAFGAEAAAYAGRRVELVVADDDRADWLTDRQAQAIAMMSQGEWRGWIDACHEIRIGRSLTSDGRLVKNRRLIREGDFCRARRRKRGQGDGLECKGMKCPDRCVMVRYCPHRNHHCPG